MVLDEYLQKLGTTDRLPPEDLKPALMGLYGEVGGILASAKKLKRERSAYLGFQSTVEEEFGDALWYLAAISRRTELNLAEMFGAAACIEGYQRIVAAGPHANSPIVFMSSSLYVADHDDALIALAASAASILDLAYRRADARNLLQDFVKKYLIALQAVNISFTSVLSRNLAKIHGRFLQPTLHLLPQFDNGFDDEERLPNEFKMVITERQGRTYLSWNGVFIGDPLTDNIAQHDDYRFHDVFHLAHACILHWSPTFRSLIKHKRKSDSSIDEAQDGGRAIVVEEGLTAWIYSRAKELQFFAGQTTIAFDILKTIEQFVAGYEVDQCPLSLWERAILQGYEVFREVVKYHGGIIIGNRTTRTIRFESPPAK